jgi:3-hydroxybutyryl-CoA dehydrogenase
MRASSRCDVKARRNRSADAIYSCTENQEKNQGNIKSLFKGVHEERDMGEVTKVGVMGAGMMGAEIALCFARSGYDVVMKETTLELAMKGKDRMAGVLDKAIQKGRFQEKDKVPALERMTPTDEYELFRDVDVVVEAVFESLEVKKEVFGKLSEICKPECIFATNTSSLPITLLSTTVDADRIERFLGAHFFSPASVMKLVEVIPGLETSEETVISIMDLCRSIDKTPIRVKDVAGFAVNRLLHAMWTEAHRLAEEGVATPEDIDTACRLGLGHPIGPFALMDLTSNDLNLQIGEILFDAYGERFKPRPILRQKVYANHLGRKTARGWYDYTK